MLGISSYAITDPIAIFIHHSGTTKHNGCDCDKTYESSLARSIEDVSGYLYTSCCKDTLFLLGILIFLK